MHQPISVFYQHNSAISVCSHLTTPTEVLLQKSPNTSKPPTNTITTTQILPTFTYKCNNCPGGFIVEEFEIVALQVKDTANKGEQKSKR